MNNRGLPAARLGVTAVILLAELAHLAWQHFHGGVVSHHVLNRADLPAISNWWGAVLLPAMTWFLLGRIGKRIEAHPGIDGVGVRLPTGIVAGFVGALAFGVGLSIAFTFDYTSVSSTMFLGVLLLAALVPLYRAERVLGFILGMAFTFGAVLPVLIGSLIAALSAFFVLLVHPTLAWIAARFKGTWGSGHARVRGSTRR